MSDVPEVTVTDNPEVSRFEIRVDGAVAGFTDYALRPGVIQFIHTEIGEAYGGQGLATKLVRAELDEARSRGLAVHPYCPFVRGFIQKHSDYRDLVPEDLRERFEV